MGGRRGGGLNSSVTLSILLFLCSDKNLDKKLVVSVKTYLSRKKSDVKDKTCGCCFAFNIHWRWCGLDGEDEEHTLLYLSSTVLKLREKMRWLHQYSLEIEQHHNYQGPVVSLYECINPTTIRSHWRVHFLQDTGQVELWTLISYRVNSDFWWK